MRIAIVIGTRPEIIKMSPVVRECEKQNLEYFMLHTGQHYSYELDKVFFEDLELPEAKYNLNVGSGSHAYEIGKMLIGIERILLKEEPDVVLVEGDTNTVLAGAIAASKLNILLAEGIPEENIFVTGNTIVDAVYQNLEIAKKKVNIFNDLNLNSESYFLVTVHRQENVDVKERLGGILEGLEVLYKEFRLPIIFPIHPRTKKRINDFRLKLPKGVKLVEPKGFLEFLQLEANAKLVLTDSGGVQEDGRIRLEMEKRGRRL